MALSGPQGHWINESEGSGFELRYRGRKGWLFPQSLYDFSLLEPHPLTWYDKKEALFMRPARKFETNLGSTPAISRPFLPQTQYPRSYCFHDSCWLTGSIWASYELDGPYEARKVSKTRSNVILWRQVAAEGGRLRRHVVWFGVAIGSLFSRKTKLDKPA